MFFCFAEEGKRRKREKKRKRRERKRGEAGDSWKNKTTWFDKKIFRSAFLFFIYISSFSCMRPKRKRIEPSTLTEFVQHKQIRINVVRPHSVRWIVGWVPFRRKDMDLWGLNIKKWYKKNVFLFIFFFIPWGFFFQRFFICIFYSPHVRSHHQQNRSHKLCLLLLGFWGFSHTRTHTYTIHTHKRD